MLYFFEKSHQLFDWADTKRFQQFANLLSNWSVAIISKRPSIDMQIKFIIHLYRPSKNNQSIFETVNIHNYCTARKATENNQLNNLSGVDYPTQCFYPTESLRNIKRVISGRNTLQLVSSRSNSPRNAWATARIVVIECKMYWQHDNAGSTLVEVPASGKRTQVRSDSRLRVFSHSSTCASRFPWRLLVHHIRNKNFHVVGKQWKANRARYPNCTTIATPCRNSVVALSAICANRRSFLHVCPKRCNSFTYMSILQQPDIVKLMNEGRWHYPSKPSQDCQEKLQEIRVERENWPH